jgi:GNAT superfamily N-acetyltransferase
MSRRRRHRTSRQRSPDSPPASGSSPEQALRDSPQHAGTLRFARPTTSLAPQDERAAVSIRIAQSEDDIAAIHRFMITHAAAEMAEAEVDTLIYWRTIQDTVTQGAGLIAMIGGEIAGYLGLWKSRYDYSKAEFMHDRGFYVLPTHRDGTVASALLKEAKELAAAADLPLKIIDTNPAKARRARSRMAITAEIIGYAPAGRILTLYPNKAG